MHETIALPPWNDMGQVAKKFRKWFNDSARHKWNDHKNHTLHRTLVRCHNSIAEASAHPLAYIDNETWSSLLSTYENNGSHLAEGSGSGSVNYNKNYKLV